jgi:hypothetical protein
VASTTAMAEKHGEIVRDEGGVGGGEAVVDHAAHGQRQAERGNGRQHQEEQAPAISPR